MTITLSILCILVVAAIPLLQGKQDREQASAIAGIAHKVFLAGSKFSVDHGVLPLTYDELLGTQRMSDPIVVNSFLVTAESPNYLGGYSLFMIESDKNLDHITVSYASPPTWQEVLWTQFIKMFDILRTNERWGTPKWAEISQPSIRSTGGMSGGHQVYLARGMTYQQVLEELQAVYGDKCRVVDYY